MGRGAGKGVQGAEAPILMLVDPTTGHKEAAGMARDSSSSPRVEQHLTHTHPEPQDGSLFGNRVLAEVITVRVRSHWLRGAGSTAPGVFIRREAETDAHGGEAT